MKKFIENVFGSVKTTVAATAAGTVVLLGLYYALKKNKTPQTQRLKTEASSEYSAVSPNNKSLDESAYMKKARQIASFIKVRAIGQTNIYDMDTITQVLEESIELAEDDYIEVTQKNRRERRALMSKDPAAYQKLVLEYNDEVEEVLKKAQQAILDILNIPFENFEESVIVFMEKGRYQEIYMFQASIRQKIKEKIASTKDITIEKAKEIISYQIEILKQQPELMKTIISKLSTSPDTAQLIPTIISNMLNDYVFNEFGVEEEDQMKIMTKPDLASDHEIILLLQEIEQVMFSLMMPYQTGSEDF